MSQKDPKSLIQVLRNQTGDDHDRLDQAIRDRFFSSSFTLDTYRGLLTKFHSVYNSFEDDLIDKLQFYLPDYSYQPRRLRLETDLEILNAPCSNSVTIVSEMEFNSEASLLGALYVVEGSEKGNQVIWNLISPQINSEFQEAKYFFNPVESNRWDYYVDFVGSLNQNNYDRDEIIRSAKNLFQLFTEAFHE